VTDFSSYLNLGEQSQIQRRSCRVSENNSASSHPINSSYTGLLPTVETQSSPVLISPASSKRGEKTHICSNTKVPNQILVFRNKAASRSASATPGDKIMAVMSLFIGISELVCGFLKSFSGKGSDAGIIYSQSLGSAIVSCRVKQ